MRLVPLLAVLFACPPHNHEGKDDTTTPETDTGTTTTTTTTTDTDTPTTDTDTNTTPTGMGSFSVVVDAGTACPASDAACVSQSTLALDSTGTPWVAWVRADSNQDGTYDDAVVEVTHATGSGWAPAMIVGHVNQMAGPSSRQVQIDVDENDVISLAYFDAYIGDIFLATSTDGGATFDEEYVDAGVPPTAIALATHAGRTLLAVSSQEFSTKGGAYLRDGAVGSFQRVALPAAPGTDGVAALPVSVALRGTDNAAFVAYYLAPSSGYNVRAAVWNVGAPAPSLAIDSENTQNDFADLDLAFDGADAWLGLQLLRSGNDQAWLVHSADAATWDAPALIPRQTADEYGAAIDLSLGGGRISAGIQVSGGTADPNCGGPKLVASEDDGGTWDLCQLTGAVEHAYAGVSVDVDETAGRRQLVFTATAPYGSLPGGILYWSE